MGNGAVLRRRCSRPSSTLQKTAAEPDHASPVYGNAVFTPQLESRRHSVIMEREEGLEPYVLFFLMFAAAFPAVESSFGVALIELRPMYAGKSEFKPHQPC
jgi:hypothetical protein